VGYRRQPTVYKLIFQEYPGLEVTARSVSVEELLKITRVAAQMTAKPDDKQVAELFGWFAKRLVSWNLEDEDGKPVPATLDGLLGEEMGFVLKIIQAWVRAITGVSPPLPNGSSHGPAARNPLEESIPMTASPGS
jgi:hypothetical protein